MSAKLQRTLRGYFVKAPREAQPHGPVDSSQVAEPVPQDLADAPDLNRLPDVGLDTEIFHHSSDHESTPFDWLEEDSVLPDMSQETANPQDEPDSTLLGQLADEDDAE